MTDHTSRREFLKAAARSAAYAAPVLVSLAAPEDLAGQGKSSQHKDENAGLRAGSTQTKERKPTGGPWDAPPPGGKP